MGRTRTRLRKSRPPHLFAAGSARTRTAQRAARARPHDGQQERELVNWQYALAGAGLLIVGLLFAAYWFGGRGQLIRELTRHESLAALCFVSPWFIGLILLTAGPILVSIVYSLPLRRAARG